MLKLHSLKKIKYYLPPIFVLCAGLFISFLFYAGFEYRETKKIESQFKKVAEDASFTVKRHLNISMLLVDTIRSFFLGSEYVTKKEFQDFVSPLFKTVKGIQALAWVPVVKGFERSNFEKEIRLKGVKDFQIKEINSEGILVRALQKQEYFPVLYLEPMKGNEMALGFDVGSQNTRLEALRIARDTGKIAATPRIRLVHDKESEGEFGFLFFCPIFQKNMELDTSAARREHLKGFVVGAFILKDFIGNAFSHIDLSDVSISIYDDSILNKNNLLYRNEANVETNRVTHISKVDIGMRNWVVKAQITDKFINIYRTWYSLVVLIFGIILTIVFSAYFVVNAWHQAKLNEANIMLKNEVMEREKAEKEIKEMYEKLKETKMHLIQSEKMAAIGQLAAGVAHEINNPIGFIISNFGSAKKYLEKILNYMQAVENLLLKAQDIPQEEINSILQEYKKKYNVKYISEDFVSLIKESEEGAERVRRIVLDLKGFVRREKEEEYVVTSVNECIEKTLVLVRNEIKFKADIKIDLSNTLPEIKCYPSQLKQVFINLLVNSVQAIGDKGIVGIKTYEENDHIIIEISDTGKGIPKGNMKKIFEPFFTTKKSGQGTGLGLSISYDIIKRHEGNILVQSEIGKGTIFKIMLPLSGTIAYA